MCKLLTLMHSEISNGKAPRVTWGPVGIERGLKRANQCGMVVVETAAGSGRKIVPCHVRRPDVDAAISHDILRVIHPGVARKFPLTAGSAIPARNDELFDLKLTGTHEAIGAPGVGGF